MVAFFKLFFVLLALLSILQRGLAECYLSNITVRQANTKTKVKSKLEFAVEVNNDCICTHVNVQLSCKGFHSIKPVDPSIFRPIGEDRCLINDGRPVYYNTPVQFRYVQDAQIDIVPVYSEIACS